MFKEILLPIDLNHPETQVKAVEAAIASLGAFQGRLHVMTVVPDFGMSMVADYFPEDYEERMLQNVRDSLHKYVSEHFPENMEVQHIVAQGSVYDEILRVAKDIGANLIIMASHRPELSDYLIGPNASRVVRHADCSVLVVRD